MKTLIKYLTITLVALTPLSEINAKSRSFGSSRSFSSSSSRSSSSSSRPSGGFSSSSSKPSSVKPSSSQSKSAFDKSQTARAIRPPTPPKPKEQYIEEFKKNNASKYPTRFSTPPTQRPSYIPPTTTYNGQQQPIYYNQQAGGYGFLNTLGQFMIYDAITDVALGAFQKDQTVYVQQTKEHQAAVKAQEEEWSAFEIFGLILFLGFIGVFIYSMFRL